MMFFRNTTTASEPMFTFSAHQRGDIIVTIEATEAFNTKNESFIRENRDYSFGRRNEIRLRLYNTNLDEVNRFFSSMREAGVVISPIYKTTSETEGFGLIADTAGFYKPGTSVQEIHDFGKNSRQGDGKFHEGFSGHIGELYHNESNFEEKSNEIMLTALTPGLGL